MPYYTHNYTSWENDVTASWLVYNFLKDGMPLGLLLALTISEALFTFNATTWEVSNKSNWYQ